MKITAVETLRIEEFPNTLYVRVHTDEGIIGLGETYWGAETVESWIHETAAPTLLGTDPLTIDKHWNALGGFVGSRSTGAENRGRSAVDIALWDIFGHVTGQPIYKLLGGASRERVRVYNTCAGYRYTVGRPKNGNLPVDNWGLSSPDSKGPYEDLNGFLYHADELAESLLSEGCTGMKIWPFDLYAEATGGHYISSEDMKKALSPFEKIRKAVGDRMDIMVEMHSLWDLPTAKRIAHALEDYSPYWIEDPIRMDNLDALKEFADSTRIAVTASETLGTRWAFRELMEKQAVGIVMFDPTYTGGISESKRIATLAEIYQLPIAPHDCVGPVEFAVAVHLSTNATNTLVQEVVRAFYTTWYRDLVTEVPIVKDGYVYPLQGPGIGTTLQPDVFKRSDLHTRISRLDR